LPASSITVGLVASPGNAGAKVSETLLKLQEACFAENDRRKLDDSYWWLAVDGKKPVGFAGLKPEKYGFAFLCLAGVIASQRGRRIHARLIRARVRFARKLGLKRLITYTSASNPASSNSLIRAGFLAYTPAYSWAGTEVCYWQKEL